MAKKKYYAVKNGHKTGIFESWKECEAQTKGYSSALFKSFETKKEALEYLGVESSSPVESDLPNENELFAYVDGSYNVKTKYYGYGVVLIFSNGETKKLNGNGCEENIASMRNVAGELKGAVIAMQYAVNNNFKKVTIFHDYEGISRWAKNEWKANLEATNNYKLFCQNIFKTIDVQFVKVLAHSGVEYNEVADELAKSAIGLG